MKIQDALNHADGPIAEDAEIVLAARVRELERLLRAQMAWNCWQPKDDAEREKAKADFDEAARFLSA